jgi:hypothetical protein
MNKEEVKKLKEEAKIEKILADTQPKKSFRIPPALRYVIGFFLIGYGIFRLLNLEENGDGMGSAAFPVIVSLGYLIGGSICIGDIIALIISWPVRKMVGSFYGDEDHLTEPPESIFQSAKNQIENGNYEAAMSIYTKLMENYEKHPRAYQEAIHLICDYQPNLISEAEQIYQKGEKYFDRSDREELKKKMQTAE